MLKKIFLGNLSCSLVSTIIRIFVNVGLVAIYSHSLDLSVFSYFALGLFMSQIICMIIDAGVNLEIMRFSRVEDEQISLKRLADSTSVRLLLGLLSVATLGCSYSFFSYNAVEILFFMAAMVSGIFSSVIETYLINIKAKNNFKRELVIVMAQAFILMAMAAISFLGWQVAVVSIVAPRVLVLYWLAAKETGYFKHRQGISIELVKEYFYRLKYYSVDSVFSNLSAQIDNCLVVLLLGREAYGLYQPISRLNNSAQGLAAAIGAFAIPLASTYQQKIKKYIMLNIAFSLFGLLCAMGMYLFSGFIVRNLFGEGFIDSHEVVYLLSMILLTRYVAAGSGSFLTLCGRQKLRATINVVLTITSFMIGCLLTNNLVDILKLVLLSQIFLMVTYFSFGLFAVKQQRVVTVSSENS